jgi:hypothetical protein
MLLLLYIRPGCPSQYYFRVRPGWGEREGVSNREERERERGEREREERWGRATRGRRERARACAREPARERKRERRERDNLENIAMLNISFSGRRACYQRVHHQRACVCVCVWSLCPLVAP